MERYRSCYSNGCYVLAQYFEKDPISFITSPALTVTIPQDQRQILGCLRVQSMTNTIGRSAVIMETLETFPLGSINFCGLVVDGPTSLTP